MQSIVANPADGTRLRVTGDVVRVLASAEQTGGAYEIFELEGAQGNGPTPHAHPWAEAYLVIAGEVDVYIEGVKTRAVAGSFVQVPAGTTHGYRIRSQSAKAVVITSPAGAGGYFAEIDAETAGSCEDMGKVVAVALKHGITLPRL